MTLRITAIIIIILSCSFYFLKKGDTLLDENLLRAEISGTTFKNEVDGDIEKNLKEIVLSFLGRPYKRSPLEDSVGFLYRTDVFDCTTLVLVTVAEKKSRDDHPEAIMKKINYHPEGNVSYETRNHFSTYRNKVSPFFEDITREVGENLYKEEEIVLNRETGSGRLIDIEWEKEVTISYIQAGDVASVLDLLPDEVGVGFVREEKFTEGLDIVHEGFVFDKKTLVHASASAGKVVKEDFINHLNKNNYTGVLFYKII